MIDIDTEATVQQSEISRILGIIALHDIRKRCIEYDVPWMDKFIEKEKSVLFVVILKKKSNKKKIE